MLHFSIKEQLKRIYERFSRSKKPMHRAYMESIHSLVNLAEAKDPYTKRHSVKVSNYAVGLAKRMGLSKKEIDNIRLAAILHDIGKIGISENILLKESSLTDEEYKEVKKHTEIGADILKPLKFFKETILMIKHHHENFDGSGYPDGLKQEKIPLGSRILSVADVYDALTSRRAYRNAYSSYSAIDIMTEESGKKFDPKILHTFMDYLSSNKKKTG